MAKKSTTLGAGELTERLSFLSNEPVAVAVTSLTRTGTTVTVDTGASHDFTTGYFVRIAGATQAEYNGDFQITVSDPDTFTYEIGSTPATPGTGTITATFVSDAQGGGGAGWRTLFTVWGKMEPLTTGESLQAQALQAITRYTATIRTRADVNAKMQLQWTPYKQTTARTFEILGEPTPYRDDPRAFMSMPVGERT